MEDLKNLTVYELACRAFPDDDFSEYDDPEREERVKLTTYQNAFAAETLAAPLKFDVPRDFGIVVAMVDYATLHPSVSAVVLHLEAENQFGDWQDDVDETYAAAMRTFVEERSKTPRFQFVATECNCFLGCAFDNSTVWEPRIVVDYGAKEGEKVVHFILPLYVPE